MEVGFARPSVSSLVFHLYGRTVHPELLRVYSRKEVAQQAYTAEIKICDAGHTVAVQYGGNAVTEVTATREQPLPQRKRFLQKRLRGNRDESFHFEAGLSYHVSYQLERLDPEVFMNIHEELVHDCDRADVAQQFPAANRLGPGPVSLIRADARARSLLIHAFHTFPESHAVVKTQSLFEL